MADSDYIEVKTRLKRRRVLKMAYNQTPQDKKKIPAIRFSGAYLSDLGFVVDGYLELIINEDNSITLNPLPQPVEAGVSDEN